MKQPVITRDLERKAIYTDILYDPEWTYVEIFIYPDDRFKQYGIKTPSTSSDYVIDWGDGCIQKNTPYHFYEMSGNYIVRIKGYVYIEDPELDDQDIEYGLFKIGAIKAIQYGTKFDTNIPLFSKSYGLEEINPTFFVNRPDLTDISAMFYQCYKLKAIPEGLLDPLTNLQKADHAFDGCKEITEIPKGLFDKNTKLTNIGSIFEGCEGITTIPKSLFDKNTKLTNVDRAFALCSKLNNVKSGLFDSAVQLITAKNLFRTCGALKKVPDYLFSNCPKLEYVNEMFRDSGLSEIPPNLFRGCKKMDTVDHTFFNTKIRSIPIGLFDDCTQVSTFEMAFGQCGQLSEVPLDLFSKCKSTADMTDVFWDAYKINPHIIEEVINNVGSYYKKR